MLGDGILIVVLPRESYKPIQTQRYWVVQGACVPPWLAPCQMALGWGPNAGQQNKKKLGCRVRLQTDLFAAVMQDGTTDPLVRNQMPHHWGSPQQNKTKKAGMQDQTTEDLLITNPTMPAH